mmetsp:Transcript_20280/g.58216  ORF Transcript_20280/g.58216 Transcript_20280/m.58216 type:complete len:221 (+) Transcript_20280:97-759(+)
MAAVRFSSALLLLISAACFVATDAFSYLDTLGQPGSPPPDDVASRPKIQPGDKLPIATLHWGFNPPTLVTLPFHCGPRNVVVVGVRGAFMEESNEIVRTYLQKSDVLKSMGVDEVIITTVNDGAVTGIWNKKMKPEGSLLTFLADPHAELMDALGTKKFDEQFEKQGILGRSKPFVMYVEGCIVKHFEIGYDTSGDPNIDAASAMRIIEKVKASKGQLVQ